MRINTEDEIKAMRGSGRILGQVLNSLAKSLSSGMSPVDLSAIARRELKALGGEPAFLGVPGVTPYPDIICISVNEQVQHSIPTKRQLKAGDVINLDFGVKYQGMITDAGVTLCVDNKFSTETRRLLNGTKLALDRAIEIVKAGARVGDISAIVQATLEAHKLGIVKELVGHGVGKQLHESPEIPNYGSAGKGEVLHAGMTIAIEPIATLGSPNIQFEDDGWTITTEDGSWAAQFEHTLLITESGCEILTR